MIGVLMRLITRAKGGGKLSRRAFLKRAGALALTGAATYSYGSFFGARNLVAEQVTVRIPNLPVHLQNTRLVHLSDLHAGNTAAALIDRALQMALEFKPAYILITGDFVDSRETPLQELGALLAPVAAKVPIYGSTGNHDYTRARDPVFCRTVCDMLTAAGVQMLRNRAHQPVAGKGELCFVGVEDFWSGAMEPAALDDAPADATTILLSHNPDSYDLVAPYRWNLMLSGHTHGGQVCIPGIGPLLLPVEHRERAAGIFHLDAAKPHRALYVTRGVGHLLRIRLFCPPEVTCITLQNAVPK